MAAIPTPLAPAWTRAVSPGWSRPNSNRQSSAVPKGMGTQAASSIRRPVGDGPAERLGDGPQLGVRAVRARRSPPGPRRRTPCTPSPAPIDGARGLVADDVRDAGASSPPARFKVSPPSMLTASTADEDVAGADDGVRHLLEAQDSGPPVWRRRRLPSWRHPFGPPRRDPTGSPSHPLDRREVGPPRRSRARARCPTLVRQAVSHTPRSTRGRRQRLRSAVKLTVKLAVAVSDVSACWARACSRRCRPRAARRFQPGDAARKAAPCCSTRAPPPPRRRSWRATACISGVAVAGSPSAATTSR